VVAVLAGALLFWLLATVGGRDTLLGRIVGMLPPGSVTWERAEGVIRGPLVLHDVRYRQDGVEFTAERVLLDPDLLPVLGRVNALVKPFRATSTSSSQVKPSASRACSYSRVSVTPDMRRLSVQSVTRRPWSKNARRGCVS
jgi:hypothetical protein